MAGWILVLMICIGVVSYLCAMDSSSSNCNKVAVPPNRVPVTADKIVRSNSNGGSSIVRDANRKRQLMGKPPLGVTTNKYRHLEWFVVERALATISVAEQIIVDELVKYNVKWYREVAFEGFKLTDYSYARYDFLIEVSGSILIIEYDGANWHSTEEQQERDRMKTAFCYKNGIPIIRYNKKHYYKMETEIGNLMAKYNISKKLMA